MNAPLSKNEFINTMIRRTGAHTGYAIPSTLEQQVKDYLKENYGLKQPIMPSVYGRRNNYTSYFEEIWRNNISKFCNLPESPDGRTILMGTKIHPDLYDKLNRIEQSVDWNNGWFSNLPYHERKYLSLVSDFQDYEKDTPNIQRFRISHIPADVKFENCIPTVGELYIAHPYRPGVYLPVSKYEHHIFRERIHELSYVMIALGATEIRTIQNSGYSAQHSSEKSSDSSASASWAGKGSFDGRFSSSSAYNKETEREEETVINFKSNPYKEPYIPDGLVWYPLEKEWQQIAEHRLKDNLLEYEIRISSKDKKLTSDFERSKIEAEAKVLFASASFSHSSSSQTFFKEESAKSSSILIKFKSRKDY